MLPELPALLRPDVPRGAPTRTSRCSACARTTTGWSRSGARGSSGRLLPLCLVPLWDPALAAAEVERNAARGVRAVAFSEIPAYLGLPSIHSGDWDPFFAACEATGTVLCLHIGSGTKMPSTSRRRARLGVTVTIGFGNCMNSLADCLFSGELERSSPACGSCTRRARSAGSRSCSSGPTTCGSSTAAGSSTGVTVPRTAVDLLLPPGVRLLLPRLPRRGVARRVSASTT